MDFFNFNDNREEHTLELLLRSPVTIRGLINVLRKDTLRQGNHVSRPLSERAGNGPAELTPCKLLGANKCDLRPVTPVRRLDFLTGHVLLHYPKHHTMHLRHGRVHPQKHYARP